MAIEFDTVVLVDTETSGTSVDQDRILEIACVMLDMKTWKIVDEWETLIAGGEKIQGNYHLSRGTFSGADWSKSVTIDRALVRLFEVMHKRTLGGHNVAFDVDFLKMEARRSKLGFPWINYHRVDTMYQALPLLQSGRVPNLKLETLRTWAGQSGTQSHRALGDLHDTVAVLKKLTQATLIGLDSMEEAFA